MRNIRTAALGAAMLALLVGACTSGGSSASQSAAASEPPASEAPTVAPSPAAGPAISTTLALGGPPECPQRPYCLKGLEDKYGLSFKEFVPLDVGGPLTVEALKGGQIQVGLLFTSDPAISVNGFVLLEDDQGLQLADNIIPVVRKEVLDANPGVADVLNTVMTSLTQDELIALNKAATVDLRPVPDVAREWITAQNWDAISAGIEGDIIVGSANFAENEILGEIFAQVLEANGAKVDRKFQLGNREIYFPALESGELDVFPEYAATVLEFANGGAGQATTDPATTSAALVTALEPKGLVALDYAAATDQNGFAVTQATADQYGLTAISDLGKPVP
jgi:glycine betaine/choline ABC-type transport system substrate-binding protein